MHSKDFLLKDTNELELEIERHCIGLGLDCSDEYQVHIFAHEMLQNMEHLKDAAGKGDRSARAKVELFGMVLMLHQANTKALGTDYMTQFEGLSTRQPAWTALAKALGSELESRNLDEE
ncbi:MAG: hypothetical protein HZB95_05885 [Nitrosomonadales bacterium]|nr:hypothetical protein [Nitrosomonadales bacterium]